MRHIFSRHLIRKLNFDTWKAGSSSSSKTLSQRTVCEEHRDVGAEAGHRNAISLRLKAAIRCPPLRVVEETSHLRRYGRRKIAACFRGLYGIHPGRETMQANIHLPQPLDAFRKDPVVENHECVIHHRTRGAQRIAEGDLASAIARQILNKQDALSFMKITFDLSHPAKTLGLLSDVDHRKRHPLGNPRRKWDSCGLSACDHVNGFKANFLSDNLDGHVHDAGTGAGKSDKLPDVHINRTAPS